MNRYIIVVDVEDEDNRSPDELIHEIPFVVERRAGSLRFQNSTVYKSLADFDADRLERLGAFDPEDSTRAALWFTEEETTAIEAVLLDAEGIIDSILTRIRNRPNPLKDDA